MKFILFFVLIFSSYVFANPQCTFLRIQHVVVEGKDVPIELKNKLLNSLIIDKSYLVKNKSDLGIALCTTLRPFKDLRDIVEPGKSTNQENLLSKVTLTKENKFWNLNIEIMTRGKGSEMNIFYKSRSLASPKSISEIKDSEVVDWVLSKLIYLDLK
jgi:hypothetical protein